MTRFQYRQGEDTDSHELQELRQELRKSSVAGDATTEDELSYVDARSSSDLPGSEVSLDNFDQYTPEEERIVKRKLDINVVLFMSFLYMLSFLDRSNIGNAKIAGLIRDLRLSDDQFEWLLTGFYITYIGFEWMILLYHILSPHVYISICVFSWGLIASLQACTTSFSQMLVLRLLLGVSEAAFSPGVPYYLSFFYRREELAFRAGIQISAAPLAASFAGSLAWVITKWGEGGALTPWRLLFLVEGFPSVIVALIAWHVVPDRPESAAFLTNRERGIAKMRLAGPTESSREAAATGLVHEKGKRVEWTEIWQTIKDPKCYLTALMFLNCNIAFSSMPVFLPSVINEMGYNAHTAQALSAPPFLLSFVAVLLTARLSDHQRTRSPYIIFHALLASISYTFISIGGLHAWSHIIRYILIYPACAGFFSTITLIITWTMNNQQSETAKGVGMTILNVVGQCGPLIGTRLYPDSDGPGYVKGMAVCAVAMGLVVILSVGLRAVLSRENGRRTKQWARSEERGGLADDAEEREPLAEGNDSRKPTAQERFVLML